MRGFLATLAIIFIPSVIQAALVCLIGMVFGVWTLWITLPLVLVSGSLLSWFVLAPMIDRVSDW